MKRWRLLIVVLVVIAVVGYAVHHLFAKRAQQRVQQRREAAYQAAIRSYSEVLKPGMTRKEVEAYLKEQGTPFKQPCCMDPGRAYFLLVKIGEEEHPWYCSNLNVYARFQFNPYEQPASKLPGERDTLMGIQIFRVGEGCL